LFSLVQEKGVRILMNHEVTGYEKCCGSITVNTPQHNFTTQKLVFALNGFTSNLLPEMQVEPARGQIIVTHPIPDLKLNGTFHADEGFYYWRHVENRVLLGGARNKNIAAERSPTPVVTDDIQQELERFLQQHILKSYDLPTELIAYRWAGIMGFTRNKQPQITEVTSGVWCAVACNGMGVALTPVIAEKLAAAVIMG